MSITQESKKVNGSLSDSSAALVSVIIPFYKQDLYLAETVNSVLASSYPHIETIVIDDGSPVPAATLLEANEHVRVIRTENRGLSAARNRGFRESTGEYLLFLDSDDRLLPGALKSHLSALAGQPNAALSFGAIASIDERGAQIAPAHICRPRSNYFMKLLEGNVIATPGAALIRRAVLSGTEPFDETFRMVEDYRLYLQLAKLYPFIRNTSCVLERRLHGHNMSKSLEPMLAATMRALDLVEAEETLTWRERQQLNYGRLLWTHEYRPQTSRKYRLRSLLYKFRSALKVSPWHYFRT